jgi:hypothetical protein
VNPLDRVRLGLQAEDVTVVESSSNRIVWLATPPGGVQSAATTELFDGAKGSTSIPILPAPDVAEPGSAQFYRGIAEMNGTMLGERVFPHGQQIIYAVDTARAPRESGKDFSRRLLDDGIRAIESQPTILREVLQMWENRND